MLLTIDVNTEINRPVYFLRILMITCFFIFPICFLNAQNLTVCEENESINEAWATNNSKLVEKLFLEFKKDSSLCAIERDLLLSSIKTRQGVQDSAYFLADRAIALIKVNNHIQDSLLYVLAHFASIDATLQMKDLEKTNSTLVEVNSVIDEMSHSPNKVFLKINVLIKNANYHWQRFDSNAAVRLFQAALNYLETNKKMISLTRDQLRYEIYNGLARCYVKINEKKRAVAYSEEALRIAKKIYGSNSYQLGTEYYNIAGSYYLQRDFYNAKKNLAKGVDILARYLPAGHPLFEQSNLFLANLYAELDQPDSTKLLMDKTRLWQIVESKRIDKSNYNYLYVPVRYYRTLQKWDSAIYYQQLLLHYHAPHLSNPALSDHGDLYLAPEPKPYLGYLVNKAELLNEYIKATGDMDKIPILWECYRKTGEAIAYNKQYYLEANGNEEILLRQKNLSIRMSETYLKYESYLAEVEEPIFQTIELNKSHVLLAKMTEENLFSSDSMYLNIRQLTDSLQRVNTELSTCYASDTLDCAYLVDLNLALRQTLDQQTLLFEQANSEYKKLIAHEPINLTTLRKKMSPKDLMLEYYESDSSIYALFISIKDFKLVKIKKSDSLMSTLEELSSRTVEDDFHMLNKYVFKTLISNYVEIGSYDHFSILPSESLAYLNFGSLVTNNDRFLIEQVAINFGYSASSLFVDGSLDKERITIGAFTNDGAYQDLLADSVVFQEHHLAVRAGKLSIPGVNEEANALVGMGAVAFKNEQATEEVLKAQSAKFDILHIASHAYDDEVDPSFAYIAFSTSENTDDDGFLTSGEIGDLKIAADLVFLSACNTGKGKFEAGEGVMSLAYSFLYAGAKSVVMTQWKIPDETTPEIVIEFYKNLKKGQRKSQALRNAKLTYLENQEDPLKRHPYYWAGFVLIGDDRPIPFDTGTSSWWYMLVAVVGIIGITGYSSLRKKSNNKDSHRV